MYLYLFIFFSFITILKSNEYFNECSGLMFGLYDEYMSPLKTHVSRCQFEPSCSEYSSQSIKQFGISKGLLMTADRLLRCSGGHTSSDIYPYLNRKFIDKPHNHSLFGDGMSWNLGFSIHDTSFNIINDTVFSFAKSLFEKGEMQICKMELLRIAFNSSKSEITQKANLLLGVNEFIISKSLKTFDYISDFDSINNHNLKFNYFIFNYFVSDYNNLNTYNINLCHKYQNEFESDVIQKFLVYSYYKNTELDSALNEINKLRLNPGSGISDTISGFLTKNFNQTVKSPALAGIMSALIPGAGYLYSGRLKEGLSAFAINGLLIYGIYALFKNGNTGSGILTSMVCVPFYLGNIIGSANAAETENIKYGQIVLSQLRYSLGISYYFSASQLMNFWE